jgi:GntR family transcriptional regulator/MocR family aminotransferase
VAFNCGVEVPDFGERSTLLGPLSGGRQDQLAQELLVSLNREDGSPLHVQIEQGLRDSIRSGRLSPGTPLPSSRALAQDLGISRGVVVEAYDQLLAEGYLIARRGSSTRVAKTGAHSPTDLVPEPTVKQPRYDFRLGVPNLAAFPRQEWVASIRSVLKEAPNSALSNDEPQGTPELREVLSSYLGRVRGVYASPSRIVICNGSSQGVRIVCQMLKQRGARRVVLEEPTHVHHHEVVVRAGLEPVCIPVDESGLRADLLTEIRANAAVVTPAHQYPTGAVLAPERRFELCAWAESQNALIVEDDYDAEYRYDR